MKTITTNRAHARYIAAHGYDDPSMPPDPVSDVFLTRLLREERRCADDCLECGDSETTVVCQTCGCGVLNLAGGAVRCLACRATVAPRTVCAECGAARNDD